MLRLFTLFAALWITNVSAAVFHLEDVTFNDGGTASGHFVFSGPFDSGTLSAWDITTSGGLLTELDYRSPASPSSFANVAIWEGGQPVFFFNVPGQRTLQIMLPVPGSIELNSGRLQLSSDSTESGSQVSRRVVGGSVYVDRQPTPSTVPEPQTWTMMLLGAMLLSAWSMHRSVIRRKNDDTLAEPPMLASSNKHFFKATPTGTRALL